MSQARSPGRRRFLQATALAVAAACTACAAPGGRLPSSTPPTPTWPPAPAAPPDVPASTAQLAALLSVRFLFGHQSIGMTVLEAAPDIFEAHHLASPRLADISAPAAHEDAMPAFLHAWIGRNGDALSKITAFSAIFDTPLADTVDIAVMKLGALDITADTDIDTVFDAYVSTMARIERAHPRVRMLYSTVTLTTRDGWRPVPRTRLGVPPRAADDDARREQYNARIRAGYASTGRLFDIADRESRIDDAQVAAVGVDGIPSRVMNPALSSDGLHLNAAGARAVAQTLLGVAGRTAERITAR